MKSLRPLKRSTSPFGVLATDEDPLKDLRQAFGQVFQSKNEGHPEKLQVWDEARFVPDWIDLIRRAPANDATQLEPLCHYLVRYKRELGEHSLEDATHNAMQQIFELKTDFFLVDHHDKESCEKLGWEDDHRDIVLFAKERDMLVGHFFSPFNKENPGRFSGFIESWIGSDSPDRLLHFLDFWSGGKKPTFEHHLLFTHPPLARLLTDKHLLRSLFDKAAPLLKKLSSPTWEADLRTALE